MTEIYIEHFVDPCPPDGVIAPHVRRTLLELLEAGVEVVDGRRLFRPLRESGLEYLYNTGDTHWAPRGMRVMAKEIATRIRRYQFGLTASRRNPIVKTTTGPYMPDGFPGGIGSPGGWQALSERQRSLAKAVQTRTQVCVTMPDGGPVPEDPSSPVFLLGHSYTFDFREQLVKELNLLVRKRGSATTEGFADFLRDPDLLEGCRVLIWVTTEQHMTHYDPMPPPIVAALADH
jgi:hypothetical protein